MAAMNTEQIHECLTDAGCDEKLIGQFEALRAAGRQKDQLLTGGTERREPPATGRKEQKERIGKGSAVCKQI